MPNATTNMYVVSGATATPAGQIIGPWVTVGNNSNQATDYAVYDSAGHVLPAGIAATAAATWTSATSAYTENSGQNLAANATAAALRDTNNGDTLNLYQYNFATNGLLAGGGGNWNINASNGALTSATAGAGTMYITTGNQNIYLDAPIADNGGPLTVVKSGGNNLYLTAPSTFSGGLVLNSGYLR